MSGYFRRWRRGGVWPRITDRLRSRGRPHAGRQSQPTAAIRDAQSVKRTEQGGQARGDAAGKKVAGRKRHVLVAVLGMRLVGVVHAARLHDRDGAKSVLRQRAHRCLRLRVIWADGGYAGTLVGWLARFRPRQPLRRELVKRADDGCGFVVQPTRGIVERTLGWRNR